jgi:hypothetical protein
MNSRSWQVAQGMAHVGFALGLILTTVFAALNLPVKLDYTIINSFNSL